MLTGREIRQARQLLRWGKDNFSRRSLLPMTLIEAVESSDGPAWLTDEQEAAIRRVFEEAGVEFIPESGGGIAARLTKSRP